MLASALLLGALAPYPTVASQSELPARSLAPTQAVLDLDECQIAYIIRCVRLGGDPQACEIAAQSETCL